MTNKAKNAGSEFERACVRVLNANGYPRAERRGLAGATMDKGDLNLGTGAPVVLECKALKTITLASILDETQREKANAKADVGVALIKRRGKNAEHAYAVLSFADLIHLLKKAGY